MTRLDVGAVQSFPGHARVWLCVLVLLATPLARGQEAKPTRAAPAGAAPRPSVGDLVRRGGWIMVPIGICSVALVACLFERMANMRRGKVIPRQFLEELQVLRDNNRLTPKAVEDLCKAHPSPMANVVKASLLRLGHPLLEVEKAMEDAAARELAILRGGIRPLTAIASIAPLLGLIGTVFGMIDAFIVTSQPGLKDRTELLASGIYEALVATAAGLLVAVPALIAAYAFTGRLDRLSREIGDHLTPIVPALARMEPPPQPSAPARRPAKF
jgi:biopolymer transport protein ExbB